MEENTKKSFLNKLLPNITVALIAIIIIAIAVIAVIVASNKNKGIETVSESSLKEIVLVSDFSTLKYTYNSYATVYQEDKNGEIIKKEKNIICYVAYKGIVEAGFDFSKIALDVNNEKKQIILTLPKIELTLVNIDNESLDSIFVKEKYDNEKTFSKLLKACEQDLMSKAASNDKLLEMAKANAESSLKALLKPWEQQGYVIEIE